MNISKSDTPSQRDLRTNHRIFHKCERINLSGGPSACESLVCAHGEPVCYNNGMEFQVQPG